MPNHITNRIRAEAKVFGKLIRGYTDAELAEAREVYQERLTNYREKHPDKADEPLPSWFWEEPLPSFKFVDFGLVIPEPENIETGMCGMNYSGTNEAGDNLHEDGSVCWYGWSTRNWGTKWNGYDLQGPTALEDGRLEYCFDTAWSHPFPVIEALSKSFPQTELEVEWADEDFGNNVGRYRIIDGLVIGGIEELSGTDEGNELAADLKYGQTYAEVKAEWDADAAEWAEKENAANRPGPHGPSDSVGTCTCGYAAGADLDGHLNMVEYLVKQAEKKALT